MDREEWRPTHIDGYEVSNLGRVRSVRILRPAANPKGYLHLNLGEGPRRTFLVHRLVAAAFIGPCPTGQEVMHKDHTPGNCSVVNLEYGTSLENNRASMYAGHRMKKLSVEQMQEIRQSDPSISTRKIAEQYGVSHTTVRLIRSDKAGRHV